MEIYILTKEEQERYDGKILRMLQAGDGEFVPPLSTRNSTTQTDFVIVQGLTRGVLNYFRGLKEQKLLAATENGHLLGLVSFRENFTNEKISKLPNIYISTVLVSPEARGRGITGKMYETLFAEYKGASVFTRTWSTNAAHIRILEKLQFETLCVLKNDRGQGVDTVYFQRIAK
ncbi:MAG: GNAT family N-acetyltransferase [Oscillospiraceae bacterium]|nr:GNAT family N-acetyltransferase [Oscillospiraceae bacterium]